MTGAHEEGRLLGRWMGLARDLGLDDGAAATIFAVLQRRYGEEHRAYHTLEHVAQVLATVERLAPYAEEVAPVQLAAWFHDAVYEPGAADNEARSARALRQMLERLPVRAAVVEEAARLILLTEGHEAAAGDGNGHVLLDADLAILGAEPAAYERYARAIRRELAHVTEEAYRRGRAAVLRSLLQREPLFYTRPMQVERERRARRNMRRELAVLEEG